MFLYLLLSIMLFTDPVVSKQPVELGQVNWYRDYDAALAQAKKEKKQVLILFQEVPGCATCRKYGHDVLSHPLIVEAIESKFVPLAIFNNKSGADKRVLRRYGEPAWNNPVVRIVDENGKDVVKRVAGSYSKLAIVQVMMDALLRNNDVAPSYLQILHSELSAEPHLRTAYLSMYCFWTGEREIAKINGVVSTEAGYMDGREVVKLGYDSSQADLKDIAAKAKESQCADKVYAKDQLQDHLALKPYKKDAESKYYLRRTPYKHVPMTAMQAMLVNQSLAEKSSPDSHLSPKQLAYLKRIQSDSGNEAPVLFDRDISDAWYGR